MSEHVGTPPSRLYLLHFFSVKDATRAFQKKSLDKKKVNVSTMVYTNRYFRHLAFTDLPAAGTGRNFDWWYIDMSFIRITVLVITTNIVWTCGDF